MEFWEICRALDNQSRIALMRAIARSPRCAQNVVQAGEHAGLKKSVTSQYLKKLAEAGLLATERKGRYAICRSRRLKRSPVARLQQALADFLAKADSTDADRDLLAKANALAHHGRIRILRMVAGKGGITFSELAAATGFPFATLRRQLGVLIAADVIATGENKDGMRTYALARQRTALFRVMVSLALDLRLVR